MPVKVEEGEGKRGGREGQKSKNTPSVNSCLRPCSNSKIINLNNTLIL